MDEQKAKEEYLKSPVHCPYCNSDDIDAGRFEPTGRGGYAEVECNTCGGTWTDVYTLTDVEFLEEVLNG